MGSVKLKNSVIAKKTINIEKKPALYALKCDGCGKIFKMLEYCNDENLAILSGTFDIAVNGNMFSAIACNFKCAHDIMTEKWKSIEEYKPFKQASAILGRCELKITPYLKSEDEIIRQWESSKHNKIKII